jgi:hypothetical protein
MISKRLLTVIVTIAFIGIFMTSIFTTVSSAESKEDVDIRTVCVFEFDFDVAFDPSYIITEDVYIFQPGSTNEIQFLRYIEENIGSLPSDDRNYLDIGDEAIGYFFGEFTWNNTIYIEWMDNYDNGYEVYSGELKYNNTSPSYYFNSNSEYVITVQYDSSNFDAILCDSYSRSQYASIPDDTEITGQIYSSGDYCVYVYSNNTNYIWTTISYDIEGYAQPSGEGSGGSIIAVLFIALSVLFVAIILLSYRNPKWA